MRYVLSLAFLGCSSPFATSPDAAPGDAAVDDVVMTPPDSSASDSGPIADCTRNAQAKTSPVSLFDAFAASQTKDVDAFLAAVAKQGGAPLEDPNSDRVIFLARGAPPMGPWSIAGSFTNWKANAKAMTPVNGTDLFVLDTTVPRKDGAAQYKLLSGTTDAGFREDSLAMNVAWDGIDHQTVGEFNAIAHATEGTKGRIVRWRSVPSPSGARDVFTWLPARYDDGSCAKLPIMFVHDGNESLTRGDFASVAEAQPSNEQNVLVFVALPSQNIRIDEYTFNTQTAKAGPYVDFLAGDLSTRVRSSFHVCTAQTATGISGASLGGLVSAWAAFEKPGTFGYVGSQSGSFFWDNESLVSRAQQTTKLDVRFHLDHGCPNDNCDSNRDMSTALVAKGYDVVHVEDPDAQHDWSFWKKRLPGVLHDFAVKAKCE